jgi:preprotein translocase subunit SecY
MAFYALMIGFFAFFYTAIVFNPKDTADNLKKHGGFIPGIRPGERTAEYIDFVLTRITVIGAMYLVFVCLLPEFLIAQTGVPFYFGGTSLLIVVSVTLDTVAQIQGHLIAQQYEGSDQEVQTSGGKGTMSLYFWDRRVRARGPRRSVWSKNTAFRNCRPAICCAPR